MTRVNLNYLTHKQNIFCQRNKKFTLLYKSKDDFGTPTISSLQYAGTYELKESKLK